MRNKLKRNMFIGATVLVIGMASLAFTSDRDCDRHHGFKHQESSAGHMTKRLNMMQKKLALSDEQAEQIMQIFEKDNDTPRRDDLRASFNTLRELNPGEANYQQRLEILANEQAGKIKSAILQKGKMKTEIYAVLNSEQQQKVGDMMMRRFNRSLRH